MAQPVLRLVTGQATQHVAMAGTNQELDMYEHADGPSSKRKRVPGALIMRIRRLRYRRGKRIRAHAHTKHIERERERESAQRPRACPACNADPRSPLAVPFSAPFPLFFTPTDQRYTR